MRRTALLMVIGLGTGLMAACGDDNGDPTEPTDPTEFAASLSGENADPPVETDATGSAMFEAPNATVSYRIEVQNLEGATAAHIHIGDEGAEGPAVVNLFTDASGRDVANGVLAEGTISADDLVPGTSLDVEQVGALLASGEAYLDIHTLEHQDGELRGQIAAEED
jgi:hypothetical protein